MLKNNIYSEKVITLLFIIGYIAISIKKLIILFFPSALWLIPDNFFGGLVLGSFLFAFLMRIKHFNRYMMFMIFIVTNLFLFSMYIYGNNYMIAEKILNDQALIIVVMALFFSTEISPNKRLKDLKVVAYIMILINIVSLLNGGFISSENETFSYMGFGYGTTLYWTIITRFAFVERKPLQIVTAIIVALLIAIFGNRGALIVILVVVTVFSIIYTKLLTKVVLFLTISVVSLWGFFNFYSILNVMAKISERLGIPSYIFHRLSNNEFFSESGRDLIREKSLGLIQNKPFIGHGIAGDRIYIGTHAHNIFLELFIDFGIILGAIFSIVLISIMLHMLILKGNDAWRDLFLVYSLPTITMLMFSNSMYNSVEFWTTLAIYCAYLNSKRTWKIKANKLVVN